MNLPGKESNFTWELFSLSFIALFGMVGSRLERVVPKRLRNSDFQTRSGKSGPSRTINLAAGAGDSNPSAAT
jgi:hypothetical protein